MTDADMSETGDEFHLSSVFDALKSDIKGVEVTSSNEIIVAGREEKIKFFARRRGEYTMYKEILQPAGLIVNSLAYYEEGGEWLLFAGRKDGSIVVYNNHGQVTSLEHHKLNVSCLHVDKTNKKLLSGSWDNNVIIWPIAQITEPNITALLLTGHTLSVWALQAFEKRPGISLSASADKTIKLWEDDNCIRTYIGHTDVVRCLQIVSNDTFISAANDFSYRVWHIDSPDALAIFPSHMEDFIFSISLVGNNLVSCGDTGFIEIWKIEKSDSGENLKHKQVIKSPASTHWVSRAISDNEFVIGGSDGRAYTYSTDPEKKAPADVQLAISDLLSEKMAAEIVRKDQEKKEEIIIKVALDEGAPNLELRYQKGADPAIAAENFIRANNLPISYLNEITDYIVANIPEARQAQNRKFKKQPTQKILVDGESYDFAMDVTIDNKTMKMPFNMGEEPDMVAFRFCEKQNIPIKYAPKFAELVRKDLQGVSSRSAADFYDPFTGSGRYVPGNTASGGGGADPLTGSGRYIPAAPPGTATSGMGDPFTSSGRYIPGSADTNLIPNASRPTDKLRPRCEFVPMTNFYSFGVEGAANPKALAKLKEANEQQTGTKMNPDQLAAMEQLLGAQPGSLTVGDVEKSALELGLMWPFEHIQMIIDLLRCALLHFDLNEYFCSANSKGPATRARIFEILVSNPPTVVKVFLCRAISNAFAHQTGRDMMAADSPDFSQLIVQVVACFNVSSSETGGRQLQLAAASALANWSLLLLQRSQKIAELGPREDVLRAIISGLEPVLSYGSHDEMAMIRMLQAVITLMWGDKQVILTAKNRNIVSIVNKLKDSITNEAGKNVARCVVEMVYV